MEEWVPIQGFPKYSVGTLGHVMQNKTSRILCVSQNQSGVPFVGLMLNGRQRHRSVALLVCEAFVEKPFYVFDTPINLNGDRQDNRAANLMWRPRWFAVKYNQQFTNARGMSLDEPIRQKGGGKIFRNTEECAQHHGLLEDELVQSIMGRTYVWPTYQEFERLRN